MLLIGVLKVPQSCTEGSLLPLAKPEAVAQYGFARFRFVIFPKLTDDCSIRIVDVRRAYAEYPERVELGPLADQHPSVLVR